MCTCIDKESGQDSAGRVDKGKGVEWMTDWNDWVGLVSPVT